ncbi:MAG: glycosyltransferase family 4 protein [Desulfovibrio sp.]|nr:glycosyltransferase family 4 protein [Desulfovibrio sp.]
MRTKRLWATLHPFHEAGSALGRREANRSFLDALLEVDPFDGYHFFLSSRDACDGLQGDLAERFPDVSGQGRIGFATWNELPAALARHDYHCLHLSDPFVLHVAAQALRNRYSRRIFPVTATTHSLSYPDYGPQFLHHMWPGVTARDAIIATSRCGAAVVEKYYASIRASYGLASDAFPAPQVRIIPLGVDPAAMPSPKERTTLGKACRNTYGIGEELCFLCFARLSFHSKMDLLPILRACKRAESAGLPRDGYRLVLAGWAKDEDTYPEEIRRLAQGLGIRCTVVPRPDHEERKALYAAADVFLSPSDNIQETFGLTLLEAAVAALPVIASDFDGYRDIVIPDVTGILVPTVGPSATPATDAMSQIEPEAMYHLRLAQQTAVDVDGLGRAMARLGLDAMRREDMGRLGRERALGKFTWRHAVEGHLRLWATLNDAPCDVPDDPLQRPERMLRHPAIPPATDVFSSHYASQLDARDDDSVRLSAPGRAVYRKADFPVLYGPMGDMVEEERLRRLLFHARHPITLGVLRRILARDADGAVPADPDFLLLWALKHDLLEWDGPLST